jgi:uncharacterized GH25 family protein
MRELHCNTSVLLLGLFCTFSASAHDFWVQPNEYWSQPQSAIPITLQVGHAADRQRSPIRLSRIARFDVVVPDGTTIDARNDLHLGDTTADGQVHFETPGTYLLVFETDNRGRSALPASRFNEYAQVEGLTPALKQREHAHRMQDDASESYRRVAKSIVQIGPFDNRSQAHVTKPLGLPLEIVPERNPYVRPRTERLPVRVLFEGRPLAGALVKLTHLEQDAIPLEVHRTDASGRAVFQLPDSGSWLLNVIWTKPLPASAEVDFDTIFSSLSFGFPAERTAASHDGP